MFVNIGYDPSLDQGEESSEPEPEPAEGEEPKRRKEPELRGIERAKELGGRFNQWFYVISDTSFKQIHKERDDDVQGRSRGEGRISRRRPRRAPRWRTRRGRVKSGFPGERGCSSSGPTR